MQHPVDLHAFQKYSAALSRHKGSIGADTEVRLLTEPAALAIINDPTDGHDSSAARPDASFLILPDLTSFKVRCTFFDHRSRIDYIGAIFHENRCFIRIKYVEPTSESLGTRLEFGMSDENDPTILYFSPVCDGWTTQPKSPYFSNEQLIDAGLGYNRPISELFNAVTQLMSTDIHHPYWVAPVDKARNGK